MLQLVNEFLPTLDKNDPDEAKEREAICAFIRSAGDNVFDNQKWKNMARECKQNGHPGVEAIGPPSWGFPNGPSHKDFCPACEDC